LIVPEARVAFRAVASTDRRLTRARARALLDLAALHGTHRYGDAHRCQVADLHLPRRAGPHPVLVLVHGGSWSVGYGRIVMRPLAADAARRGFAVWNIEYRRIGRKQGGGWPATFEDVAAAVDHLTALRAPLDLSRVTIAGHSAGGQLALWAAGRPTLAPGDVGAGPRVLAAAAVSAAGMNDLAASSREHPHGIVDRLLGGGPDDVPGRYAIADPIAHVPLPLPVLLVHGTEDRVVTVRRSRDYAGAARERGGEVELVEIAGSEGEHRRHIDPSGASWATITGWLARR
jgi:acetyl esterase/lipase